jgi:tRNA pseudouridine55 synthase
MPAAGNRPPSGLALLRKPQGVTSFSALSPVKRAVGSGRVGHAGTLDRFARGLLVALTGSYSRIASYVMSGEKLYRGLIVFGSETDTLDPEGKVIAVGPPPSAQCLLEALPAFRGPILQRPPAYSAVHIGGRRAYKIALEGGKPEVKERRVEIVSLDLLSYEGCEALVEVRCSSGTYIRSLARDIAAACGSRGHLRALERLAIGSFRVEEAVDPEAFDPLVDLRDFRREDAEAFGLRAIGLEDPGLEARFRNGRKIDLEAFSFLDGGPIAVGSEAAVFGSGGKLLGIILLAEQGPKYKVVISAPAGPVPAGRAT